MNQEKAYQKPYTNPYQNPCTKLPNLDALTPNQVAKFWFNLTFMTPYDKKKYIEQNKTYIPSLFVGH